MKLVKSGYGSLKDVKEMDAREVLQAIAYDTFTSQYESEAQRLNSESS